MKRTDREGITLIKAYRTCAVYAVGSKWAVLRGRTTLFGSHDYPTCCNFAEGEDNKAG